MALRFLAWAVLSHCTSLLFGHEIGSLGLYGVAGFTHVVGFHFTRRKCRRDTRANRKSDSAERQRLRPK